MLLRTSRGRQKRERFLIEGARGVRDALLRSECVEELLLAHDRSNGLIAEIRALAAKAGIPATIVDAHELERVSAVVRCQGVVAIARMPAQPPTRFPLFPDGGPGVGLVLDGVADPGNLGTLVRTADAAGCVALLRTPGSGDLYNPKIVRAAAGSLLGLPPRLLDPATIVAKARAEGIATVLLSAAGTTSLDRFVAPDRLLIVAGSEPRGAGEVLRNAATHTLSIALHRGAESLNVAVATAVVLFALRDREPRNT